ncbi:DUF5677 domain-containing protein [Wukongibacter baidiensis]|uniref:DUF5677 domain-containing protein n=1 Tax=Wukongibacter baidiensis TaxID=1723361 RepID=UPI003D7F4312
MIKQGYFEIIKEFDDALAFLGYVVDEFGDPIGLEMDAKDELFNEGVHHDYVYFCFTKMLRSACAYNELAKQGFREDCMAIGRTIYETYLQVSNALKNPDFISTAVFQSLKLKVGLVEFAKENGRVNRNKIYDPKENKIYKHDLRTTTLVRRTLAPVDRKLHKFFYEFMSELIHSNFISVGNYRTEDNSKYNVDTNNPHADVIFTLGYLLFIICEHMEYYHIKYEVFRETSLTIPVMWEFICIKEKLRRKLKELVEIIEIPGDIDAVRQLFLDRIKLNLIQ